MVERVTRGMFPRRGEWPASAYWEVMRGRRCLGIVYMPGRWNSNGYDVSVNASRCCHWTKSMRRVRTVAAGVRWIVAHAR